VRRLSRWMARTTEEWRAPAEAESDDSDEHAQTQSSYLQVLLNDYTLLREDLQSVEQVTATLMSIAVALIGALGVFLLRVCDGSSSSGCDPQPELWPPVYALLPLPPLAILGFIGSVGNVNTLRTYYLRLIERAISRESGSQTEVLADSRASVPNSVQRRVPVPSFTHLQLELTGLRRGSMRVRFLFLATYIAIGVLFIGATGFSLWLVEPTLEPPRALGQARSGDGSRPTGVGFRCWQPASIRSLWLCSLGRSGSARLAGASSGCEWSRALTPSGDDR
jgi:hypothetical protein